MVEKFRANVLKEAQNSNISVRSLGSNGPLARAITQSLEFVR